VTDTARIRELMLVNLFAVFNERNAERRLKAIANNYTEDVIWTDPEGTTHGHERKTRASAAISGASRSEPRPSTTGVLVARLRP